MDTNGAPPKSYQFGIMPDNGIPALEFCRSVISIINDNWVETKLNNPAASYLAARSGVLQLPVQTLRSEERRVGKEC